MGDGDPSAKEDAVNFQGLECGDSGQGGNPEVCERCPWVR